MGQGSINTKLNSFCNKYFFSSTNLLTIGILRVILVLLAASNLYGIRLLPFQEHMLTELHERSLMVDMLGKTVFFSWTPSLFSIVFAVSAIGSLIGMLTRPSLFVFGLFAIYLTGIRTSLGVFDHSYSLVSQIILILAFIPGSTNLSFDRLFIGLLKYKKGIKISFPELLSRPQDKIWGLRLLLMVLACVYFTAGFSKMRYGGLKWLDGKTLTYYLNGNARSEKNGVSSPIYLSNSEVSSQEKWKDGFGLYAYSYGNRQSNPLAKKVGEFIAENKYLIMFLSTLTVIFELSSFFLLIDRWPRTLYLSGAIILHTSIGFLMGLTFIQFRIICFLLIDWQWVFSQLSFLKKKIRFNADRRLPVSEIK